MMARAFVFFIVIHKSLTNDVLHPNLMLTAQPGENVTLTCDVPRADFNSVVWFKQPVGHTPQFVVASYRYSTDYTLYNGFNHTNRFVLRKEGSVFNLHIYKIRSLDSATYYCAVVHVLKIQFLRGTFLNIQDSKKKLRGQTIIQQPVSESVLPGDSVTLQCTVDSGIRAGEYSVYWFRRGSGESLPGLIYTHGNRSDEAGSPTQSCVYSLPKRNLSRSDAGTYYCAVATCGEILFGNGTKLDIEESAVDPVLLGLGVTLFFSLIFITGLVCYICKNRRCKHCTGKNPAHSTQPAQHVDSTIDKFSDQYHDTEMLNYAALHFPDVKIKRGRKKQELGEKAIYSGVKCPK